MNSVSQRFLIGALALVCFLIGHSDAEAETGQRHIALIRVNITDQGFFFQVPLIGTLLDDSHVLGLWYTSPGEVEPISIPTSPTAYSVQFEPGDVRAVSAVRIGYGIILTFAGGIPPGYTPALLPRPESSVSAASPLFKEGFTFTSGVNYFSAAMTFNRRDPASTYLAAVLVATPQTPLPCTIPSGDLGGGGEWDARYPVHLGAPLFDTSSGVSVLIGVELAAFCLRSPDGPHYEMYFYETAALLDEIRTNAPGSSVAPLPRLAVPTLDTLTKRTLTTTYQRVTLTWTDTSGGETGFDVEYFEGSCEQGASVAEWALAPGGSLAANTVQYVSPNLMRIRKYCFRVRARADTERTAPSNPKGT